MPKELPVPIPLVLTVAVVAFLGGYFSADVGSEPPKAAPPLMVTAASDPGTPIRFRHMKRFAHSESRASVDKDDTNDSFAKFGISAADLEATLALNKRQQEGEYLLKYERPTTKRVLNHDFNEIVSATALRNAGEYNSLFAELDITPETGEELKTHISKIHRASLEAEVAIKQVLVARRDYDQRLRFLLSEEDYSRYRRYEESKPALREYQSLESFAQAGENLTLDPTHKETLIGIIQAAQAYSQVTFHHPYDGLPQVATGASDVIAQKEQEHDLLIQTANVVLQRATEDSLPPEYTQLLQRYYETKVTEIESLIKEIRELSRQNPAHP